MEDFIIDRVDNITLLPPRSGPADTVAGLLSEISRIGTDQQHGGYWRPVFSTAEFDLRAWFLAHAAKRGLDVTTDRNGVIWAWWHTPDGRTGNAVVTGSHLDSVPGGGAFDGPLGVASALVAVDILRADGVRPERPLVIAVFPEEEGSRFGVACLGTRLLTGAIDVDRARTLRDRNGDTFAEVAARSGIDPSRLGPDPQMLAQIGTFIELHVEQGRDLIDRKQPVGIGSSILGHGRWRLSVTGQGNHAGTTLMTDRRDPMIAAAGIVMDIRDTARAHPGARATVGRLEPVPGGTNVIASRVDLWLDARHPDDEVTASVVTTILAHARRISAAEGCTVELTEESVSRTVDFDGALRDRLSLLLPDAPVQHTGAGHDAGILARFVPTAMLFVRNPTGVSHSPEEYVDDNDAEAGARALARVLADLLVRAG
ncbi:MAG: allantoate amidohydrolase [Cryobacterium sp.]|uniref:allantoate amidohydrolase n=1 Tax=unclassified Cryobacterium TaxID=2649013 RepID=UPI0018CAA199|nr:MULTISPECIES: allantoate amidohydrolase [unclassified Cryobacterium]MCY7404296.1 allantoate amidohydrolase [Cryobacterium sp.]MEC5153169.1 N-carbamoyl-L-amino-acid hydrolase [Cryobacterium sp. CAN_C3]